MDLPGMKISFEQKPSRDKSSLTHGILAATSWQMGHHSTSTQTLY
jgi:hypothetical protein